MQEMPHLPMIVETILAAAEEAAETLIKDVDGVDEVEDTQLPLQLSSSNTVSLTGTPTSGKSLTLEQDATTWPVIHLSLLK
jgi:hypothetical protein